MTRERENRAVMMVCAGAAFISLSSAPLLTAAPVQAQEQKFMMNGRLVTKREYEGVLLYQQGVRQLKANDNKGAVDNLSKSAEMFPDFAPTHLNLGVALAKTGQPERAIDELKKSRDLDPTIDASWMSIAGIYQTQGRIDEAVKAYKEFLAKFPGHPDSKKIASLVAGLEKEQKLDRESSSTFEKSDLDYLRDVTREGVLRWRKDRMPLTVYIENGSAVPGYEEQYSELLKRSFVDWANVSDGLVAFEFLESPEKADIKCSWTNDPARFKNIAEAGETQFVSGKNGIINGSIKFLTVPLQQEVPVTPNRMRAIFLHEIGHVLGMAGHTNNPSDAMFFSATVTDEWRDLTDRDAATIKKLYSYSQVN